MYFVEDGIERQNVFQHNLGAVTRKCGSCLKSDTKPATFWTSSPNNIWRDNVAAGSVSFGFWFELPEHPTGPSSTDDICPFNEHLGEFRDNIAHSNGHVGLRVYPHWTPREIPCDDDSPSAPQYLRDFTSFHSVTHGESRVCKVAGGPRGRLGRR